MKHIVTMVGTSLFTNYMRPEVRSELDKSFINISDYFERYGDFPAVTFIDKSNNKIKFACKTIEEALSRRWLIGMDRIWEEEVVENETRQRIKHIKWVRNENKANLNASAEITSIRRIIDYLKVDPGEITVYLLATDTVSSALAAEMIAEFLPRILPGIGVVFNNEIYRGGDKAGSIIESLQINNRDEFARDGLRHLVDKIEQLVRSYGKENLAINITGGYKASIPYLTIIGQVYDLPIYYIFEQTDSLLAIPQIPINIDWNLFVRYADQFTMLDKESVVKKEELSHQFLLDCNSCIEIDGNLVAFNPIGQILYKRFVNSLFIYYASDQANEKIIQQPDILRIIKTKFKDRKLRESKTEMKGQHLVFDDGDNNNRIYYFEKDGKIYIYATFQNEGEAKRYIDTSLDSEKIMNGAKKREIKLEV